MVWLVVFGFIVVASLLGMIFTKWLVHWENKRIIEKGKEEPMTNAEIKRTIVRERFLFFVLFFLNLANVVEYIDRVFMGGVAN